MGLITKELTFDLEHKQFVVSIDEAGTLQLYVDNCLRKQDASFSEIAYVWTNIELNWEEHRYVEVRLHRPTSRLLVTVNKSKVYDDTIKLNSG